MWQCLKFWVAPGNKVYPQRFYFWWKQWYCQIEMFRQIHMLFQPFALQMSVSKDSQPRQEHCLGSVFPAGFFLGGGMNYHCSTISIQPRHHKINPVVKKKKHITTLSHNSYRFLRHFAEEPPADAAATCEVRSTPSHETPVQSGRLACFEVSCLDGRWGYG